LKLVYFKSLDQFSPLFIEIREFNIFNKTLIGLYDVWYAFQDYI